MNTNTQHIRREKVKQVYNTLSEYDHEKIESAHPQLTEKQVLVYYAATQAAADLLLELLEE